MLSPIATYRKAPSPQWSLSVKSLCDTGCVDGNPWQEEVAPQRCFLVLWTCCLPFLTGLHLWKAAVVLLLNSYRNQIPALWRLVTLSCLIVPFEWDNWDPMTSEGEETNKFHLSDGHGTLKRMAGLAPGASWLYVKNGSYFFFKERF